MAAAVITRRLRVGQLPPSGYHPAMSGSLSPPIQRSNEQWVQDLQAGGPARDRALEDLRWVLRNGLRRGLLRSSRGSGREFAALADDFVQDALLKILERLDTFRGESRFTTWAQKVSVRVALTELRRKRWQDVSLDELVISRDGGSLLAALADPREPPERATHRKDLVRRIQRYIREELTERQRLAMVATAVRGMPMEEVARRLGTNRNALYKLLHDARRKLKRRMVADGFSPVEVLLVFSSIGLE